MANDVFGEELRRLVETAIQPGPMYGGWQNPLVDPNDKGGNGVYATPFDRQGGPAVAERELVTQMQGILQKFLDNPESINESERKVIEALTGKGQSPADHGAGAPPVQESPFQYGANLSGSDPEKERKEREERDRKEKHEKAMAAANAAAKAAYDRAMSGESEEERRSREERERREREGKEKIESVGIDMKALAGMIVSAVDSAVDKRLSAAGYKSPQAASLEGQGAGAWRDQPGVAVPQGMGPQGVPNQYGLSAADGIAPTQTVADKFLKIAAEYMSGLKDDFQRGKVAEGVRTTFAGILSGAAVDISDPVIQSIADKAGVQYINSGSLGGAR